MGSRNLNVTVNDDQVRQRYQMCMDKLARIFNDVQQLEYNGSSKEKAKLFKKAETVYNESGLKVFTETMMRMMCIPFASKDTPFVKKLLEFFFEFVTDERWVVDTDSPDANSTVCSNVSFTGDMSSSESIPMRILKLCERYHNDGRALVRHRVLLTIIKIISSRIPVTNIGYNYRLKLVRMALIRINDKSDLVRTDAASILCSCHKDGTSPFFNNILDALLVHMAHDPEVAVRARITSEIKISEDSTLEHVVERTGDPSPTVRAAAINRVTNDIKLACLSLEMREAILKANATEENRSEQDNITSKNIRVAINAMLESWLQALHNDPCEFLRVLNVRRRPILCRTALDNLYNQAPEEAFEKMRQPVLKDKKYPEDSLCTESTYIWLYMFERFKDEQYIFNKLALQVNEMIDYIYEYIEVIDEEGELPQVDMDYRGWMLGDLLKILCYLPNEEGTRQAILKFLPQLYLRKPLMDSRNCSIGLKLLATCCDIQDETYVVDIVNQVIDSDRPSTIGARSKSLSTSASVSLKSEPDDMKLELGNLMHRKKKLERDQAHAIGDNDLFKAQSCQDQIVELDAKINLIKAGISEAMESSQADSSMNTEDEEEEERWVFSDRTMLVAMSTVKANILLVDRVSDFSSTFYRMYAVPAIAKCKDPSVRAVALELMCLVALRDENESAKAALYCLMALLKDKLSVKESALKCLYDLVFKYSFPVLGSSAEVKGVLMGFNAEKGLPKLNVETEGSASTLKSLLLAYIRDEEVKLVKVSVAGVLKLLFKRELNTSRIITNFMMNWAVPTYETQLRFKDVGVMIPIYASKGEEETIEVAQCLMQCINKIQVRLHSGPRNSELPHPDADKIISLVVKATDPTRLSMFQRPYIGHETIARSALQELKNVDLITDQKLQHVKLLKVLDLRLCPAECINDIRHSVAEITDQSNKTVSLTLVGFSKYLDSFISNSAGDNDDHEHVNAMDVDAGDGE